MMDYVLIAWLGVIVLVLHVGGQGRAAEAAALQRVTVRHPAEARAEELYRDLQRREVRHSEARTQPRQLFARRNPNSAVPELVGEEAGPVPLSD